MLKNWVLTSFSGTSEMFVYVFQQGIIVMILVIVLSSKECFAAKVPSVLFVSEILFAVTDPGITEASKRSPRLESRFRVIDICP